MEARRSEDALSALEHSTRPLVELLDQAASILGLSWRPDISSYEAQMHFTSQSDCLKFRHQWVLKWLLKRLAQAAKDQNDEEQSPHPTTLDVRTWNLLQHLLTDIPQRIVREILGERNFCQSFGNCLDQAARLTNAPSINDTGSVQQTDLDTESGRATKRRRVSNGAELQEYTHVSLVRSITSVVVQVAQILCGVQQLQQSPDPSLHVRWIADHESAARFLGQLLAFIDLCRRISLVNVAATSPTEHELLNSLGLWLHLYEQQTPNQTKKSKRDASLIFNEHVLIPALKLLHTMTTTKSPTYKNLERLIALNTVISVRSAFLKHNSGSNRLSANEATNEGLERVLHHMKSPLGTAAAGFDSLDEEAGLLLSIASRLIPRSDMTRRNAEAIWLEAFFCCLSQLTVGQSPEFQSPGQRDASTQNCVEVKQPAASTPLSEALLDALEAAVEQPSSVFWRTYLKQFIVADGTLLPTNLLVQVVRLNPALFVPSPAHKDAAFLEAILSHAESVDTADRKQRQSYILEVLQPVLVELGRSRQLETFTTAWEGKICDTYYNRMRWSNTLDDKDSRTSIWDHPALTSVFASVCRSFGPISLYRSSMQSALGDLAELVTIVGPTNQIFARLTVFSSLLSAWTSNPTHRASLEENAESLVSAVYKALLRPTDYQGQRWQLWRMLCLIPLPSSAGSFDASAIQDVHDPFLSANSSNVTPAELLEQFWCFCLFTQRNWHKNSTVHTIEKHVQNLRMRLEDLVSSSPPDQVGLAAWNGSAEDMDSPAKLVAACLARLQALDATWAAIGSKAARELLSPVWALAVQGSEAVEDNSSEAKASLVQAADGVLWTVAQLTDLDLTDIFLEACEKYSLITKIRRLKPLLNQIQRGSLKSDQAGRLANLLSCDIQTLPLMKSPKGRLDYLSVLHVLLKSMDTSSISQTVRQAVTASLESHVKDFTTEQLMVATQIIHGIEVILLRHLVGSRHQDALLHILEAAGKKLKKPISSKSGRMLDTFEGYFVLELVGTDMLSEENGCDRQVVKLGHKLEKRFFEVVVSVAKHHLDDSDDVLVLIKISKLLETAKVLCLRIESNANTASELLQVAQMLYDRINSQRRDENKSSYTPQMLFHLMQAAARFCECFGEGTWRHPHPVDSGIPTSQTLTASSFSIQAEDNASRLDEMTAEARNKALVSLLSNNVKEAVREGEGLQEAQVSKILKATAIISRLQLKDVAHDIDLLTKLGYCASLGYALDASSPISLIMRLDLGKTILDKHPAIINQEIIDNVLASVALLASSATKITLPEDPTSPRPQHIFDRLCSILQTTLVRYRRRLPDRHHLVLAAVQNLLRCLFGQPSRAHLWTTRDSFSSKAAFRDSLPRWLNPRSYTSTLTLPPTSAAKFSRVIQTLADPSASAAHHTLKRHNRSSRSNSASTLNLTDEKNQLKHQVSRHTQYLLQSYCQASLDGYIAPEVRDKLVPGLYAVISGMDIEIMRALNAAMDESQRAIWKDLYAEWSRFGKWNQQ